jgi:hypothetical protein
MKKVIISILALVVVLAGVFMYMNYRSRTLSPPANASLTQGALTINIDYSRPTVRNRVIFGTKEAGALQPYGEYWRLGANESTEIKFSTNVLFNGKAVNAGTYRMYAVPGAETFDILLNTELGAWGAFTPDATLDILRTTIPVQKLPTPTEQFTVTLQPSDNSIAINLEWERVKLTIPVQAN